MGSAALGQDLCTIPNYTQAWVDPVNGDDATAVVANKALPFRTIGHARAAVQTSIAVNNQVGVVHCLPGVYSLATNGEILPISMVDQIHIRGVGAKECVIRGGAIPNIPVFLPIAPMGAFAVQEVLVDFSTVISNTKETASIDGFTLLGGDVQVFFNSSNGNSYGRVSNCLFDMRDVPKSGLIGPSFGILMVNPYLCATGLGYQECRASIFHNTFIQGYRPAVGPPETARAESVAICDVTDNSGDPNLAYGPGPYPALRGLSCPSIQNNLIRCLPDARRTALLGVDESDTTFQIIPGFPLMLESNAFHALENGQTTFDETYTFCSVPQGKSPKPVVDLMTTDPGFVGEMIGDLNLQAGLTPTAVRDFRLLFDSPLVNRGRYTPVNSGPCAGILMYAGNGNCYSEPNNPAYLHGSFQHDGEGFGNPRVAFSWAKPTLMPMPDIGFDETDTLVIAGCYANESRSHSLPWDSTIGTGSPYRWYLLPDPPDAFTDFFLVGSLLPYPAGEAWSEYPGSGPAQTFPTIVGEFDLAKSTAFDLGFWPLQPIVWIDPIDGSSHSVRSTILFYDDTNILPMYLLEQAAVYRFGTLYLTNMQPEHL